MVKFYKFLLFSMYLIFCSCITNPNYTDRDTIMAAQAKNNPGSSEEIRRNQEELQRRDNIKIAASAVANSYTIVEDKTSSLAIGSSKSAINLGFNKYTYVHKIGIRFVCNKNDLLPFPTPIQSLKVDWYISDKLKGDTQTGRNGEIGISFSSEDPTRQPFIYLNTSKNHYRISLDSDLIVDGKIGDCPRKDQ